VGELLQEEEALFDFGESKYERATTL